jgi:hypothetical protein
MTIQRTLGSRNMLGFSRSANPKRLEGDEQRKKKIQY